jgi:hypothetical protein
VETVRDPAISGLKARPRCSEQRGCTGPIVGHRTRFPIQSRMCEWPESAHSAVGTGPLHARSWYGPARVLNWCCCPFRPSADMRRTDKGGEKPKVSMSSSAWAKSSGGTARPSALVVLRVDGQLEFRRLLDRQLGGLIPRKKPCGQARCHLAVYVWWWYVGAGRPYPTSPPSRPKSGQAKRRHTLIDAVVPGRA